MRASRVISPIFTSIRCIVGGSTPCETFVSASHLQSHASAFGNSNHASLLNFSSTYRRAFTSIPIVDVGPLVKRCIIEGKLESQIRNLKSISLNTYSVSEREYADCIKKLHDACSNVGFFYAIGHGISENLTSNVLKTSRQFFFLPDDEKQRISIQNSPLFRGYQKLGENVTKGSPDWHEAIDFYKETAVDHPDVIAKKPLHGPNQWPLNPPEFRPTIENYVSSATILGRSIMQGIAVALGAPPDTFEGNRAGDPFWCLRIIGYPPIQTSSSNNSLSCGEHTDYGLLTLIKQDEGISALQVRNRQGDWILADPIPHTFVVNIGDMLKVWTNGLYEPTPHRVMNTNKSYRVSVPFFYEPNFDAIVEPLQSCLDPKLQEPKFKPLVYGDHLIKKVYNNFSF